MLKSLIILLLSNGLSATPAVEPREMSSALASGSVDEVEARLLLAELKELQMLGDELGAQLIGDDRDDFDDGIAKMLDDERFAEFLGRQALVTRTILDRSQLMPLLASSFDPAMTPPLHQRAIVERFTSDCERLSEALGPDPLASLQSLPHGSALVQDDAHVFGRSLIEMLYEPSATPVLADVAWSLVRLSARMLVVRHVSVSQDEFSEDYIEGVFEKSSEDVHSLGSFLASMLGIRSSTFPTIDLRLETLKQKINRQHLKQVVLS